MSTRRHAFDAALIVLTVAAALLAPATPIASAAAAPVITVTPVINASYPRQVPTAASGETVKVAVVVSSSEPVVGATAFGGGPGLAVTNPNQPLGNLAQPVTVSFDVAGTEPGIHAMFVTVMTSGDETGAALIKYVWTTGSPLLTGTNGLYGRSYGWQGTEHVAGLESSTRAVRMLTIVSKTFAYVGLPAHGRPTCTQEGNGCLPYAFDYRTGLLQVGTGIIAAVHRNSLYTDGLVPADEQSGELFGRFDFPAQDDFSGRTSVLDGTFRYSSPDYPTGLTYEKVTFRKDGSYSLAYAYAGGKVRKLHGKFRLGKHGEITFRSLRGKVVQRGTALGVGRPLPCVQEGTCRTTYSRPGQRGIWLILSGKKGKHPDGNLLRLVR